MIQYARFSINCTSKKKEDKRIYKEFKDRMKKYLLDEVMELYKIPISVEEYAYAHELAVKYPAYEDEGNDIFIEDPPGLYIDEKGFLETNYSKEDFKKASAYMINFWYFAYTYDDMDFGEVIDDCCSNSMWRYGYGYTQNNIMKIPSTEFKKKKYAKLQIGYALDEDLVNLLVAEGMAEKEDFWEVKNKQGKVVCYQIKPQNVVSGFAKDNNLRLVDKCANCGLERYEGDEQPYYIGEETLKQLKYLNQTKEVHGPVIEKYDETSEDKRGSLIEPWYIVNKEVYELLSNKCPKMQFIPLFQRGNG